MFFDSLGLGLQLYGDPIPYRDARTRLQNPVLQSERDPDLMNTRCASPFASILGLTLGPRFVCFGRMFTVTTGPRLSLRFSIEF